MPPTIMYGTPAPSSAPANAANARSSSVLALFLGTLLDARPPAPHLRDFLLAHRVALARSQGGTTDQLERRQRFGRGLLGVYAFGGTELELTARRSDLTLSPPFDQRGFSRVPRAHPPMLA
jgi:hypothetical protein